MTCEPGVWTNSPTFTYTFLDSVNGQVLHNHYGATVMREGRLAICDSGAENAMHYAGDMTRTFPVGKRFTTLQREMYDIVLGAQEAAVAALRRSRRMLHCSPISSRAAGARPPTSPMPVGR